MKEKIMIVIGITSLLIYFFYPKNEPIEEIHQGVVEINTFEVIMNGAIVFPGVYTFYGEITLQKVVSFAGGFLDDADINSMNLNQIIKQNREFNIPFLSDDDIPVNEKININEASFKELLDIPYMTESRAASLVIYREQYGYFQSVDDLIFVKYIGEATLENLRPYVTI